MANKKANGGSFKLYKTYSFQDKDPCIDILRTEVQQSGNSYGDIAEASGISETTLYNWFHGKTRRPHFATVAACAGALGMKVSIGDRVVRPKKS